MAQHPELGASSQNDEDALSALFLVEHENIDLAEHPWYQDIIYYLQFQKCLENFENHQHRRVHLETSKYLILGTSLFHRTVDGLILHCIDNIASQNILKEIHGSVDSSIDIGGHFAAKSIAHKILRTHYYWPFNI